jgi:thiamine pyrophosphate-dependent acetolactate synthase large subunit-like protein
MNGPGPATRYLFGIDRPKLDWLALAKAMGLPARRIETSDALYAALLDDLPGDGPGWIEVRLRPDPLATSQNPSGDASPDRNRFPELGSG